jgi:cytochrome c
MVGKVGLSGSNSQLSPAGGRPFFLILTGELAVPVSGAYRFFLESNDGAMLWMDGIRVLSNDGRHPTARTGCSYELEGGFHRLEVRWFRAGPAADSQLKLFWDYGTDSLECIPEEYFRVRAEDVRRARLEENPKRASFAKKPAATQERRGKEFLAEGARLAEAAGCLLCHRENGRENGPAFREVARRYAGKSATGKLVRRVYNGSSGEWGSQPMPPQSRTGRENIRKIVNWILSLTPAG